MILATTLGSGWPPVWYQPSALSGLDTTILELASYPPEIAPLLLARHSPASRSLIGRRTSSNLWGSAQPLQDSALLDYDRTGPTRCGRLTGKPLARRRSQFVITFVVFGVSCPVCQGQERSFTSSAQRVAARAPGAQHVERFLKLNSIDR
jgi:hypothetical protein